MTVIAATMSSISESNIRIRYLSRKPDFFLLYFTEFSASDQNIETAGMPVRTDFQYLTVDHAGKVMREQRNPLFDLCNLLTVFLNSIFCQELCDLFSEPQHFCTVFPDRIAVPCDVAFDRIDWFYTASVYSILRLQRYRLLQCKQIGSFFRFSAVLCILSIHWFPSASCIVLYFMGRIW